MSQYVRPLSKPYTPAVRTKMSASARAAWSRRKANGFISDRDVKKAARDLYVALKMLLADIEDYQRVNYLGGSQNHCQVRARAAGES